MTERFKDINIAKSKEIINRRKTKVSHFVFTSKLALSFLFISIIILSLAQLFIVNKLATEGERIKQNELLTKKLSEENINLQNNLQTLGSLSRISKLAESQGFVKIEKVEYFNPSVSIAALKDSF
jgi:cell division protein FtsL